MKRSLPRRLLQSALRRVGYEIHRLERSVDPFGVQARLVADPEPVVFDVGAHVGQTAAAYRAELPGAWLHCFEPFPDSCAKLREAVAGDARVACRQLALSDAEGRAILHANRYSATNSLLATDGRGASFWGEGRLETVERIEVATTTVDAYVREAGLARVDVLKMDVQGSELAVLRGARGLLERQAVGLIYMELILAPTYQGQHALHEYLSFLAPHGYELLDLFNPVRTRSRLIQADLLLAGPGVRERLDA